MEDKKIYVFADELAALAEISQDTSLYLILSVKHCTILDLALPKIPKKDVAQALMSLLEDRLIQDFEHMTWRYEKTLLGYRVYLWDKSDLQAYQKLISEKNIQEKAYILDWQVLAPGEVWIDGQLGAYIHTPELSGFLPAPLFEKWYREHADDYHFYAQAPITDYPNVIPTGLSWQAWVLERLKQKSVPDLFAKPKLFDLQRHLSKETILRYGPWMFLVSTALWIMTGLSLLIYQAFLIHQNNRDLQKYAAVPTDRLEQSLMIYQKQQTEKNKFWSLWVGLQRAVSPQLELKNIVFEQNKLRLTFIAKDLLTVQMFKKKLQAQAIRVEQAQAQTSSAGVRAVFDLQGGGR